VPVTTRWIPRTWKWWRSHMAMYDNQQTYMHGVIAFIKDVDAGKL
jgi:hypothetical protein